MREVPGSNPGRAHFALSIPSASLILTREGHVDANLVTAQASDSFARVWDFSGRVVAAALAARPVNGYGQGTDTVWIGPCGLMDKASDFGSEDCRFESCHGRPFLPVSYRHGIALHRCRAQLTQSGCPFPVRVTLSR